MQGCHFQFEPYAFALNHWAGDGRYNPDARLRDEGPIRTSLGDLQFGSYQDFFPLLAKSNQFQTCITDHLIQYAVRHTNYDNAVTDTVLASAKQGGERSHLWHDRSLDRATPNFWQPLGPGIVKYRFALSRRTLLKASGITLGLPFLDCMTQRSVYGAEPDPGAAMISLMYGLGSPYFVLDRGFEGPLRYYQTLVDNGQLSLYTDVNMAAAADVPVDAQHHNGQPYLFSGYRTQLAEGNNVIPQGPSLHFEALSANYPTETPTAYRIIDCGIYFRRGLNYQTQRIYDREGRNAADFEDVASPVELFEKLFGTVPQADAMGAKERAARSIMDYLRPAYEKYTSGSSNLPAGDIAVLNNHLERIRQIERNVYAVQDRPVVEVTRPNEPSLDYKVDGGNDSEPERVYHVNPVDFEVAYQLLGDIFVAGLEANMFRFGNLSFDSGAAIPTFRVLTQRRRIRTTRSTATRTTTTIDSLPTIRLRSPWVRLTTISSTKTSLRSWRRWARGRSPAPMAKPCSRT